ncbi:MAG: L-lysine 6-transaminase [Balneolales bacterium]|nr:L-lysine 6-transaminase [Balneolales bacterium]
MSVKQSIDASQVHKVLGRRILADGFDMVLDLDLSEGPYLHDSKYNKRYLDFFTFFASNPIGMNHPMMKDPDFINKIGKVALNNPSNSDVYTLEMAEFVDTFDRVGIPSYMPYAFFVAGGGLAVENALKVAFDWKVQKNFEKGYRMEKGHKILHLEQAFHGRTGYTMSLTNTEPNKVARFPKFDWPRISNPKMKFPVTDANNIEVAEAESKALAQAERYFEMYKDEIAGIILEPIQGEGGDNQFRPQFHQALRDLANKHEALLIYDEVQTGVGLTGKFWCHQHYVKPDILAFGKKAQVCGILAGERIDEVKTNVFKVSSRINSTWGGNLVDMVRFQRYLEIIEANKLVDNAHNVGSYLLDKLVAFTNEYEYVTNARGKGLMCAFDFPDHHSRAAFTDECYQNGLLILQCGTHSVRFRPPLTVTNDHIDEGMAIIEKSYKSAVSRCPVVHMRNYKQSENGKH